MVTLGTIDVVPTARTLQIRLIVILLSLGLSSVAGAASLTLVPTTSVTDLQPGDIVTFDVEFDFTGDPTIGGGFDILFDPNALQFLSFFRDPSVGDEAFSRDPDILNGLLSSWCVGDFSALPETATLGNVVFEVLPTIGASTFVVASNEAIVNCGQWIRPDFFSVIFPNYIGFGVTALDTDGDGDPNHSDPDDDNDGIGDALDTDPLVANNVCTTRNGDVATVAEAIVGDRSCAARVSVDIEGLTKVMGGNLTVISPLIRVFDGVEVDGGMTAINADPCPGC